jgi:hypothetical protein
MIPALLAAEITARMGRDPGELYSDLTREFGEPVYERVEAPATPEQKAVLAKLSAVQVKIKELAGEKITAILTNAPGNGAPHQRAEGSGGKRVVCCAALRHRRHLQDLRGKFPRGGPSEAHPGGSTDDCQCCYGSHRVAQACRALSHTWNLGLKLTVIGGLDEWPE